MEPYYKADLLNMKVHPELSEKWVQELIANDPSIIGLGDLELRSKEKSQPNAGRLDLLLQDPVSYRRYEVELQLGATDERHIVRTIEYWDIERKRYPQYEHCAVLIAEDITSRFLNVISLFNGSIPIIAIQMTALRVNGSLTLFFTRVLDELKRGFVDEDEEAEFAPTDRAYWEKKGSKESLILVDSIFERLKKLSPGLQLRFNKHYIGLHKDQNSFNFVVFVPKKSHVNLGIALPKTSDVDQKIEAGGLDALEYNIRNDRYRVRITEADLKTKSAQIDDLIRLAYDFRSS